MTTKPHRADYDISTGSSNYKNDNYSTQVPQMTRQEHSLD